MKHKFEMIIYKFEYEFLNKISKIEWFKIGIWDHSSVGLERTPDKGEVGGSIPLGPTKFHVRYIISSILFKN
jgi:hypothetical protein